VAFAKAIVRPQIGAVLGLGSERGYARVLRQRKQTCNAGRYHQVLRYCTPLQFLAQSSKEGKLSVTNQLDEFTVLTPRNKVLRIDMEVHVGWCPPGTSNPVDLPLADRSVRFRHTSAKLSILRSFLCEWGKAPSNGFHPHESSKASEEDTLQGMEGSQAPGAGASWHASTYEA
jgi:hypothetical protein